MPRWVGREVVLAIHRGQIVEHGGAPGLRDAGALDIALDRPRNRHAYGESDVIRLAASYAFGLARNHAFVDGNKRVSAVVTELFLALNGAVLTASDAEVVATWTDLAAGRIDEDGLAAWFGGKVVADAGTGDGIA